MADRLALQGALAEAHARLRVAEEEHARLVERGVGHFPAEGRAELDAAAGALDRARERFEAALKALAGSDFDPYIKSISRKLAPSTQETVEGWIVEIAGASPTVDDDRLGYVEVQISRDLWLELQAWAATAPAPVPPSTTRP